MITALLIIDVQVDMFAYPETPVYRGDYMLDNIKKLILVARKSGAPVIYVQHSSADGSPLGKGKPGWQIHPCIAPEENDTIVNKKTPSAFHKTALKRVLAEKGINRLVICGMQTEYCIDTTVRHGSVLGYELVVAQDAHSTFDLPPLAASEIIFHHQRIWKNWFAQVAPSDEIAFI